MKPALPTGDYEQFWTIPGDWRKHQRKVLMRIPLPHLLRRLTGEIHPYLLGIWGHPLVH